MTFGEPTTDEMMFGFVSYAFVDEPEQIIRTAEQLENYAGKYDLGGFRRFEIVPRGSVLLIAMGDRDAELEPVSEREFNGPFGMRVTFNRGEGGKVDSLTMMMGENRSFTAKRLK